MHQSLRQACDDNKTAEAKRLIAEGAPLQWQMNEDGQAPLHWASGNGNTEIVMLLLENKCDANVTTRDWLTPLNWDVIATNEVGDTPLFNAARNNSMTVARELAWSLCDLKTRNQKGKTAAEEAKRGGCDALAEYLANQAPREQVRFASCACDVITRSSTRLFFDYAYYPLRFVF